MIPINPDVHLVGNTKYLGIAGDCARAFRVLSSLPCDVFLASHGSFFSLQDKAAILEKGGGPNPFIDPDGYRLYRANQGNVSAQIARRK